MAERDTPGDDRPTQDEPPQVEEGDATSAEDGPIDPEDEAQRLTDQRRQALASARRNALPPRFDSWRKRTATGAVLTGFALGFQEALGMQPEKPAIVMEASGDPPDDLPVDAEVDQIRPADNVVRIRPWLLPDGTPGDEEE